MYKTKGVNSMLQKEYQRDIVCDACNGTRFVGVMKNSDGFDFIDCEKCQGTGYLQVVQYGFPDEEEEE
jgi:DnaJ-class molecular chaperone